MEQQRTPLNLKFVSTNAGKIREISELFQDMIDNNEISLEIINVPIQEIQGDPDSIIREKLSKAIVGTQAYVMIEDTSLFFEAWGNLPGPYIKDFRQCLGVDGLLKMLKPFECKKARVECRIGLSCAGRGTEVFLGAIHGEIVSPKGKNDFLWDPIFKPDGFQVTYAEMNNEEKNKISDRAFAANLVKEYLRKIIKENNF